jgi:hypothetical protein
VLLLYYEELLLVKPLPILLELALVYEDEEDVVDELLEEEL